jgi:hypothetical protein
MGLEDRGPVASTASNLPASAGTRRTNALGLPVLGDRSGGPHHISSITASAAPSGVELGLLDDYVKMQKDLASMPYSISSEIQQHYEKALKAVRKGDYSQARDWQRKMMHAYKAAKQNI